MDVTFETLSSFPPDLNLYSTIFLCLGIFPESHQLTSSEGQSLVNFLNNGGSLYMEGGDTWAYDPNTPVHSMFYINGIADGSADMGTILGQDGTFAEGMTFDYLGDNDWMDHIEPIAPAFKFFENQSPQYGTGVAYNDGNYKTIGTSHEFGGLVDGSSPSTKAELMAAYLEFLGITVTLQASFSSDITLVCTNNTVDFFDQSTGNPTTWQWIFEGGTPSVSSEQNPSIIYSTAGSYDVLLTVSDGTESNTLMLNDYITVITLLEAPAVPTGEGTVCAAVQVSSYNTTGITGISAYNWLIEPSDAGDVINLGLNVMVVWTNGFLGDASLKVAGENICGIGAYSDPIIITRYLPEVTLEPFDWVCVGWPSFELTGGSPEGGEYSGPGIINGWFNPASAGIGIHTITYTYTDPDGCENFASETILVDPCTWINENSSNGDVMIFPNPGKGIFTLNLKSTTGNISLEIFNTHKISVYKEDNINFTKDLNYKIDLHNLSAGIYFLRISSDDLDYVSKIIIRN